MRILAVIASIFCASLPAAAHAGPARFAPLDAALERLSRTGEFSGAVVIRGPGNVLFAKGYGFADPFQRHPFEPSTPVDSASLAKPFTAAAVLLLAREGRIDLDAPVANYLPEYPHPGATVRHLLAHSAGLAGEEALAPVNGKTNEVLLGEIGRRNLPPAFMPGSRFSYCNMCYNALALLVERVTGLPFLQFIRVRLGAPARITIRPQALSAWSQRAIGFRTVPGGSVERADSYEGEAFYGGANLSLSAMDLAEWGAAWWGPTLEPVRRAATTPARIGDARSGLTWGSWHCAPGGRRCHYLGHHEGFHHLLYWDADRRLSIAMVTNNSLAPTLQQPLQRALVAFAEGRSAAARSELANRPLDHPVVAGSYRLAGERVRIDTTDGPILKVTRRGIAYDAYPLGSGVRYVPGLDVYLAGSSDGALRWLSLYENRLAEPIS